MSTLAVSSFSRGNSFSCRRHIVRRIIEIFLEVFDRMALVVTVADDDRSIKTESTVRESLKIKCRSIDVEMGKKLFLLHTVGSLIETFRNLCTEVMPEVELVHLVDESLLKDAIAEGRLTPSVYRRVGRHALSAQDAGASALLVTCSSISPCVDVVQKQVDIPVLKIDEAMADRAVELGDTIGVIATLPSTLVPTVSLVESRAAAKCRKVSLRSALCEGAFDALMAGDVASHDRIVIQELASLMKEVDVIVLSQASMARVAQVAKDQKVPILSSPRLGIERTKEVLDKL